MRHGPMRQLVILCVVVILASVALHSMASHLSLSARSVSNCQRCCQPQSSPETEARVPPCILFCCSGLPGAPEAPIPPVLSLAVALPGLHDRSVYLAHKPPPPKFLLSITSRHL